MFEQRIQVLKISPRTPTETALWVIKPLERFSLEAKLPTTSEGLEALHTHLNLTYRSGEGKEIVLTLGAELFHALMELADGFQLAGTAAEDIFANLEIFTQQLAEEESRLVYAWNPLEEDDIFKIEAVVKNETQALVCTRVEVLQ